MGRGKKLEEVLEKLGHVAEGVTTAKSAYQLAKSLEVELYEHKAPLDAVRDVLTRPLKREWG